MGHMVSGVFTGTCTMWRTRAGFCVVAAPSVFEWFLGRACAGYPCAVSSFTAADHAVCCIATAAPTTQTPTTRAPTTPAPTTAVPTTKAPTTRTPTQHPTQLPTLAPTSGQCGWTSGCESCGNGNLFLSCDVQPNPNP